MCNSIFQEISLNDNFNKKLDEYACLAIKKGVNIQKGQTLVINCDVKNYIFAHKCMDQAYLAGAGDVKISWSSEYSTRERVKNSNLENIAQNRKSDSLTSNSYAENGASSLYIVSENPNLFAGIDAEQLTEFMKISSKVGKPASKLREYNKIAWCIIAIPGLEWAKTVFPELDDKDAISKLWDSIFEACRIEYDGRSIENWNQHIDILNKRAGILNNYNFKSLHYTNSLGTDIEIELADKHHWCAASSENLSNGSYFVPNIPTEEIFTAPKKCGSNGVIYASKPLSLNGNLIEGIKFEVKNGQIVDISANTGAEFLKVFIDKYKNADYFGEVALVPYNSAISNQKMIYFETLFDENASCHLAFGSIYPENIKNGQNMSKEELEEAGLNSQCDTHVDFMVGTEDLDIVGTTFDGQKIQVFKNGNFVF